MNHVLINAANLLILASFLVRDILWLRVFSIVAGFCFMGYAALDSVVKPEPLVWNAIFITLNTVQVLRLLRERRPVVCTPDEERLYRIAFRALDLRAFCVLIRAGHWRDAKPGDTLVAQGETLERVMVLERGELSVQSNGVPIAQLREGRLIGEMSFLVGGQTSAAVIAQTDCRYVEWESQILRDLLEKHSELRAGVQCIIGRDLVAKLRSVAAPSSPVPARA
jgi:hypothetical protein